MTQDPYTRIEQYRAEIKEGLEKLGYTVRMNTDWLWLNEDSFNLRITQRSINDRLSPEDSRIVYASVGHIGRLMMFYEKKHNLHPTRIVKYLDELYRGQQHASTVQREHDKQRKLAEEFVAAQNEQYGLSLHPRINCWTDHYSFTVEIYDLQPHEYQQLGMFVKHLKESRPTSKKNET